MYVKDILKVKNMKLLYCYKSNLKLQDIIWGFIESGVEIVMHDEDNQLHSTGEELEREVKLIKQKIMQEKCDGVVSWNYFHSVSIACEAMGVPYISWIFDSPELFVYANSMHNSCNHIFIFDKYFYHDVLSKGGNCYYLPLAVNDSRLGAMNITDEQIAHYSEDVSFVGSLYTKNEYNNGKVLFTDEMIASHEAIFRKQYGDWKNNYFNSDDMYEVIDKMNKSVVIDKIEHFPNVSMRDVFVGLILYRKMAEYERARILSELANHCRVTLYNSQDDHSMLKNVICKPESRYEDETPLVYFSSKINLNITLRSIQTGLPLRVFDIMGVGGFLMSNYQQEFEELYTPDKDVVLYSSIDELIDKTKFYLTHERERLTIAMSGYKRTISEHTMKIRAVQMLNTVFGDKWRK